MSMASREITVKVKSSRKSPGCSVIAFRVVRPYGSGASGGVEGHPVEAFVGASGHQVAKEAFLGCRRVEEAS